MSCYKYKEYVDFKCDSCNHIHDRTEAIFDKNGGYIQCESCSHCMPLESLNEDSVESSVKADVEKIAMHNCQTLGYNNFIPFATTKSVVKGLGNTESNLTDYLQSLSNQGRNIFSGRVLANRYEVPLHEDIDCICFTQLMKDIEEIFGLQNYRNITTVSVKTPFNEHEFLSLEYPEIDQHDFFNKNISNFTEKEKEVFMIIQDKKNYSQRTSEKTSFDHDFWLELLKKYRNVKKGSTLTLSNFFDLSSWSRYYWSHILLIDTLTKSHPARSQNSIRFRFDW